jgi:SM-20-related protein
MRGLASLQSAKPCAMVLATSAKADSGCPTMTYLDFETLDSSPLQRDPYEWLIVENFIRPEQFGNVSADFPKVPGPGSHPPAELSIKGHFDSLMKELQGDAFRAAIEKKFDIDLTNRPTMYTVRGFVRQRDGEIHTDSKTKLITVLLYMNEGWESDGGRLRILRSGTDLEDKVAEVPPYGGTLLAFRRADNSWHGHKPHEGPRRAIQLNWVTDQSVVDHEQSRHRFSTRMKKIANTLLRRAG